LEENGCRSESSEVYSLEVRQRPVLPGIRSNSPVCFGHSIQLEADFTDAIYYWSGPDSFSSGLSMPEIKNATPQKDGWYRLAMERNGCFSAGTDSIYVQVLPELSIPVITGQRYFLCQSPGSRVELCIDPNSIRTGDVIALVNAATSDTLIRFTTPCVTVPSELAGLINSSNILFAVVVNGNCTSFRSNAIVLEWDALPSLTADILQGNQIQVCDGNLVNVQSLHGPPDVDITWFGLNPGIRFSNPDLPSTSVSGLSPGMNSIVLAYSYRGCTYFSTDTIIITVDSRPEAFPDEFTLPFFTASTLDIVNNDVYSGGVTIRIVSPPSSGLAKVEGNNIIYEPEVSFTGETRMTYEICSRFCPGFCSTAEIVIRVDQEKNCRPPNIITPNEDGINDAFIVPCLFGQQYPGNSLVIFNEWGNEVFAAKNYNNDWKGQYNGSPLPGGTYYYFLDLGDGNKPLNGFLIIQR
jgi:gliding motility-associated-like protein